MRALPRRHTPAGSRGAGIDRIAIETRKADITAEVEDESDQRPIFFTGTAVDGPVSPRTDAYAHINDVDRAGPTGRLENTHRRGRRPGRADGDPPAPAPVNDVPVKTGDLAQEVVDGGIAALPGSTDTQVDFAVAAE